jgi:hypothetical protein
MKMNYRYCYWQIAAITFVIVGMALMLTGTGQAQVSEFDRANPVLYARAKAGMNANGQAASKPKDASKDTPKDVPGPVPVPTPAPAPAPAPAASPATLVATPEEDKDLKIAQLSAQLAQSAFSQKSQTLPEFNQFQQSLAQLNNECTLVIAKHKWPAGTVCDVQMVPIKFCTVPSGVQAGPSPCAGSASAAPTAAPTAAPEK